MIASSAPSSQANRVAPVFGIGRQSATSASASGSNITRSWSWMPRWGTDLTARNTNGSAIGGASSVEGWLVPTYFGLSTVSSVFPLRDYEIL